MQVRSSLSHGHMQVFLTRRGRQSLCVFVIVVVYKRAYSFFNIFTNFFVAQHLHVIMPTAIERVTTRLKTRERERQLHVHTLSCIFIWVIACLVCRRIHFYFLFFGSQFYAHSLSCNCMRAMSTAIACLSLDSQLQVSAHD